MLVTVFEIIAVLLIVSIILQIVVILKIGGALDKILTMLENEDGEEGEDDKKDIIVSDINDEENEGLRYTLSVIERCKLAKIHSVKDSDTTVDLFNYFYGIDGSRMEKAVIHSTDEFVSYIKDNSVIYDIRCNRFRVVENLSTYGHYTLLMNCSDGNVITFLEDCFAKVEVEKSEIQRIA